jgi:membrane protein
VEFVDRSVALAGKAFVSFFPFVIVVAAFLPDRTQASIITALAARLGLRGDALSLVQGSFASSDDVRQATGVFGLVLTIFFASSFTTSLQRVYIRSWRRPPRGGIDVYWHGVTWLAVIMVSTALQGTLRSALDGGLGLALFVLLSLTITAGVWTFTAWWLLLGDVRVRVLVPTGVITSLAVTCFALSAAVWMPEVVSRNEEQFGFFGVALALVTWFSGAAICLLIGACAGPVLAESEGGLGRFIRGSEDRVLKPGAAPPLPSPSRELGLRDAFRTGEDE